MKIICTINGTTLENDDGFEIPSVIATCSRCGHTTKSFGTSERSKNRCLVLLNKQCPNGENNFYVVSSLNKNVSE